MTWREVITAAPDLVHGQVRFGGTRIPVGVVLDCLASGISEAEILNEYPTLPARAVGFIRDANADSPGASE